MAKDLERLILENGPTRVRAKAGSSATNELK